MGKIQSPDFSYRHTCFNKSCINTENYVSSSTLKVYRIRIQNCTQSLGLKEKRKKKQYQARYTADKKDSHKICNCESLYVRRTQQSACITYTWNWPQNLEY